jgi:hypothetical protein
MKSRLSIEVIAIKIGSAPQVKTKTCRHRYQEVLEENARLMADVK